jgi:hypothetical protein
MLLVTTCVRCQDRVSLPQSALGLRVRCPLCRATFVVQAATPLEELQRSRAGAKPEADLDQAAPPAWAGEAAVAEEKSADQPTRAASRQEGRRRDALAQPDRDSSRPTPPPVQDPYRRSSYLFGSCFLPLGMPLLLLFFVPGGIIPSSMAVGLGGALALATMLLALVFVYQRWKLSVRTTCVLGTVTVGYALLLVILLLQWQEFSSGKSARGTLAAGLKKGESRKADWITFTPPGELFSVRMPDRRPVLDGDDFNLVHPDLLLLCKLVQYQAEDPSTHLVYTVRYVEVDQVDLGGLGTAQFARAEKDRILRDDFNQVIDEDPVLVIGNVQAECFHVRQAEKKQQFECVLYLKKLGRVLYLSVSGPADELKLSKAATSFFESLQLQ